MIIGQEEITRKLDTCLLRYTQGDLYGAAEILWGLAQDIEDFADVMEKEFGPDEKDANS